MHGNLAVTLASHSQSCVQKTVRRPHHEPPQVWGALGCVLIAYQILQSMVGASQNHDEAALTGQKFCTQYGLAESASTSALRMLWLVSWSSSGRRDVHFTLLMVLLARFERPGNRWIRASCFQSCASECSCGGLVLPGWYEKPPHTYRFQAVPANWSPELERKMAICSFWPFPVCALSLG